MYIISVGLGLKNMIGIFTSFVGKSLDEIEIVRCYKQLWWKTNAKNAVIKVTDRCTTFVCANIITTCLNHRDVPMQSAANEIVTFIATS